MTFALPRNIQLKLEQTLAQWSQWHCAPALTSAPEVVRVLTPGVSNFSVLVQAQQHFVVRIDGLNPSAHGLSRQTEWRTLEAAHRAGLAPTPRYCNPELGSLVCDYLAPEDAHGCTGCRRGAIAACHTPSARQASPPGSGRAHTAL